MFQFLKWVFTRYNNIVLGDWLTEDEIKSISDKDPNSENYQKMYKIAKKRKHLNDNLRDLVCISLVTIMIVAIILTYRYISI